MTEDEYTQRVTTSQRVSVLIEKLSHTRDSLTPEQQARHGPTINEAIEELHRYGTGLIAPLIRPKD